MGGVLSNGFDTPVREILIDRNEKRTVPAFEEMSIGRFNIVVQQFVAKAAVRSEQDFILPSSFNDVWNKHINITNGNFLSFCKLIIESLAQIAVLLRKIKQRLLVQDIQDALVNICNEPGCTPFLQNFFQRLIKWAEEEIAKLSAGSALNNVISGVAATLQKTGKNSTKQIVAASAARRAFAASVVVDVGLLGFGASYSYHQYKVGNLSYSEHKQVVAKRSAAAIGSITGTTAGAFVGSLMLPGVGTFFGGFIGGMIGDSLGSKVGEELYDAVNPEDKVSPV